MLDVLWIPRSPHLLRWHLSWAPGDERLACKDLCPEHSGRGSQERHAWGGNELGWQVRAVGKAEAAGWAGARGRGRWVGAEARGCDSPWRTVGVLERFGTERVTSFIFERGPWLLSGEEGREQRQVGGSCRNPGGRGCWRLGPGVAGEGGDGDRFLMTKSRSSEHMRLSQEIVLWPSKGSLRVTCINTLPASLQFLSTGTKKDSFSLKDWDVIHIPYTLPIESVQFSGF